MKSMKIYIDESKKIWEWKIIIWWFFTLHNMHFIEKFMKNKKNDFSIPENAELKSTKKYWKLFIENLKNDKEFNNLEIYTFWFKFENYYLESEKGYINLIIAVLDNLFNLIEINKWDKINIFHDNFNANNKSAEKSIDKILNDKFSIKSIFKIHNSKKYLSLQLADLIVWEYKKYYLYDDVNELEDFIFTKDFKNKKT